MKKRTNAGKTAGVVLAAGLGKRMQPLTSTLPKPLLPILGVPLFEITVEKLLRSKASRIHSNLYHLADRFEEFAAGRGWPLTFHRESILLGTGGGIGNMAGDLAGFDTILLHNGDILSSIDYAPAVSFHTAHGALVTLLLLPPAGTEIPGADQCAPASTPRRLPPPSIKVTGEGEVVDIGGETSRAGRGMNILGYTGIAVLSSEALNHFPENKTIGLVDVLLEMIGKRPGSVLGYNALPGSGRNFWGETGSPGFYLDLHRRILREKARFDPLLEPPPLPIHIGDGASIDPGARWKGFLEVGPKAVMERNTSLEDCVILEGTVVHEGSSFRKAILYPGGTVQVV